MPAIPALGSETETDQKVKITQDIASLSQAETCDFPRICDLTRGNSEVGADTWPGGASLGNAGHTPGFHSLDPLL